MTVLGENGKNIIELLIPQKLAKKRLGLGFFQNRFFYCHYSLKPASTSSVSSDISDIYHPLLKTAFI